MSQQDNVTYQQRLAMIQIISAVGFLFSAVLFSVGLTFAATGGNAIQSSFDSNVTKIENQGLHNFGESLVNKASDWIGWASVVLGVTIMGSVSTLTLVTRSMRLSIDPNYFHRRQTPSHNLTEQTNEQSNLNANPTYDKPDIEFSNVALAYSRISSTGYTGNRYFATRKRLSYHPADKQFKGTPKDEKETTIDTEIKKSRGTLPKGFGTKG